MLSISSFAPSTSSSSSSMGSVVLFAEMAKVHPYLLNNTGTPRPTWADRAAEEISADAKAELQRQQMPSAKAELKLAKSKDQLIHQTAYRSYIVATQIARPFAAADPANALDAAYKGAYGNILQGKTHTGTYQLFGVTGPSGVDSRIKLKTVFQDLVKEYNDYFAIATPPGPNQEQIQRHAEIKAYLLKVAALKGDDANAVRDLITADAAALPPGDDLDFANDELYKAVLHDELLKMIAKYNQMVADLANLSDQEKDQLKRLAEDIREALIAGEHGQVVDAFVAIRNDTQLGNAGAPIVVNNLVAFTDVQIALISHDDHKGRFAEHAFEKFYFSLANVDVASDHANKLLHEKAYDQMLGTMAAEWKTFVDGKFEAATVTHQTAHQDTFDSIKAPVDTLNAQLDALAEIYNNYCLTSVALDNGNNAIAALGDGTKNEEEYVEQLFQDYNTVHHLEPAGVFSAATELQPKLGANRTDKQKDDFKKVLEWDLNRKAQEAGDQIRAIDIHINPNLNQCKDVAINGVTVLTNYAIDFVHGRNGANVLLNVFQGELGNKYNAETANSVTAKLEASFATPNTLFQQAQTRFFDTFKAETNTLSKSQVMQSFRDIKPYDASMFRGAAPTQHLQQATMALHQGFSTAVLRSQQVSSDGIKAFYVSQQHTVDATPKELYHYIHPAIKTLAQAVANHIHDDRMLLNQAAHQVDIHPDRLDLMNSDHAKYNLDFHTAHFLLFNPESIDSGLAQRLSELNGMPAIAPPLINVDNESRIKQAILYCVRSGGDLKFGSAYELQLQYAVNNATQVVAQIQQQVNNLGIVPHGELPDAQVLRAANLASAQARLADATAKQQALAALAATINPAAVTALNAATAEVLDPIIKERAEQTRRLLTWGQQRRALANGTGKKQLLSDREKTAVTAATGNPSLESDELSRVRENVPVILKTGDTFKQGEVWNMFDPNTVYTATYTESGSKKSLELPIIPKEKNEEMKTRVKTAVQAFVDRGGLRDARINLSRFTGTNEGRKLVAVVCAFIEAKYPEVIIKGVYPSDFNEHRSLYTSAKVGFKQAIANEAKNVAVAKLGKIVEAFPGEEPQINAALSSIQSRRP